MKRILATLLVAILLFSMAGCVSGNGREPDKDTTGLTTVPTTEPTTVPTTEPTTVPTTEPTTVPTTEPTTVPTTEPTTVPTTEPTTEFTEAPTTNSNTTLAQHYIQYCGRWSSTEEYHFIELFIEGGVLYLTYSCCSVNATRIAEAIASIELSDIQNDRATFYYSDDGWGNSGSVTLDFSQPNQIGCTVSVSYWNASADWGIHAGTYDFVR